MTDAECVDFLQWALPGLRMRWPGFRRVRRQVCKRLKRRIQCLGVDDASAYRHYLVGHPEEWSELDRLCQVTVSRFYRDRQVFIALERELLPHLAQQAAQRQADSVRGWSAGCARGEEPYTLMLLWKLVIARRFPGVDLHLLATDINPQLLNSARRACYPFSTVKNLPPAWRDGGFTLAVDRYCLQPHYRQGVEFMQHDIRSPPPDGPFDFVLCRNLVLTYFDQELQSEIMNGISRALVPGGYLVIGVHEQLPDQLTVFRPYNERLGIYQLEPSSCARLPMRRYGAPLGARAL